MLVENCNFTTVYVIFLRVGHTHEYIDGTYTMLSAQVKRQYIISLPKIMDNYRTIQNDCSFIPYPIEKVFDFKTFVKKHLLDRS